METASLQYSVKINSLRKAVKRKLATAAARAAAATTPKPKPKPRGRIKQPRRSAAKSTPVAAAAATTTKKGESAKSSSGRGSAEKLPYKRTARQMAKVRFVKKEDYENEKAALKWATKEFAKEQKAAIVAGGAYAKRSSKTIAAEANAQYGTAISSRNVTRLVKAGVVGTSPPRPGRPRSHPTALTDSVHAQMQLRQLDGSGGMTSTEIMGSLQDAARTEKTLVKIWDEFILRSRRGQTAFSDVRYNFDLLLSPLSSPDLSPPSLSSTGSRVKYPSPNSKLGQVSTYTLYLLRLVWNTRWRAEYAIHSSQSAFTSRY